MIKFKKAITCDANCVLDPHGKSTSYTSLPIDQIVANPNQPRKYFSPDALQELAASIKVYGLLQPISVRPTKNNRYEIIAGERRYRACKQVGFSHIKAIIHNSLGNEDSAVLAMIENIQRANLHFFEEAQGIQSLLKEHGLTQEELAIRLGKNQSTIANKLRILKLPRQVKCKIVSCGLTERHSRALLRLHNEKLQLELIEKINGEYLSVKQTETLVEHELEKMYGEGIKKPKPKQKLTCSYQIYINTVKKAVESLQSAGLKTDFGVEDLSDKLVMTVKISK